MKNQKVLFITTTFLPNPSANGVCAYNLARVLMDRGYSVEIIANRDPSQSKLESLEGITVQRIKNLYHIHRIRNKAFRTWAIRINILLHIFIYPLDSVFALFKYCYAVYTKIKHNEKTILICLNHPLIGCLAGVYAKRKFRNKVNYVLYDVDSFSNTIEGRFLKQNKKAKMVWKWERLVFHEVDLAIIMKNHEIHYSQENYQQFAHKIRIANFPMIYDSINDNSMEIDKHNNCVYLGTLSKYYRNPEIVCEVFSRLPNALLHFYGKIDDVEKRIFQFMEISHGRIQHGGMVSFSKAQDLLKNASVLISIGNNSSDMVPSKTFEYMSYRKPIIHFYSFDEDPVISILSRYPIALLLDSNQSIEILTREVEIFLDSYSGKIINSNEIRRLFFENTPEYSIDIIETFFDG